MSGKAFHRPRCCCRSRSAWRSPALTYALALPANLGHDHRPQLVAAVAAIAAIALVVPALVAGERPARWHVAVAIAACGPIYDAIARRQLAFIVLTIAPCLPLVLASELALRSISELHVHDNVAMVAPLPLLGGVLAGTWLTAIARRHPPHRTLAAISAATITAGSAMCALAFFLLGLHGMPRRYVAYSPEFQSLQVAVGIGAAVAVVGVALAVEAVRRGAGAVTSPPAPRPRAF